MIFWGTPEYVLPIAEALEKYYNRGREKQLIGVVTQAPKPAGREKWLAYSPIDKWAHRKNIPIYYEVNKMPEADLGILAAYGEIIPEAVINKFKWGILNVHPSLLPRWRGASPVQAAIAAGEAETGVSVIKMDKKLDHGAIVSSFRENIKKDDTTETLRERLFLRSSQFLVDPARAEGGLIPNYLNKKIRIKEQDHTKATYAKTITKKDGYLQPQIVEAMIKGEKLKTKWEIGFINQSFETKAEIVERFVRAMRPWPTAWTFLRLGSPEQVKRLKISKAHIEAEKLILDEVQLEGKNPVSWKQLTEGYPQIKFSE